MATINEFKDLLEKTLGVKLVVVKGTKFHKIMQGTKSLYMVHAVTNEIYGAKSPTQYNPRRLFGTLATITEWEWAANSLGTAPKAGTQSEIDYLQREQQIVNNYGKRGRPRKVVV